MGHVSISQFLATKNTISVLLTISIPFLFLFNNVKSDFSFNFPTFGPEVVNIIGFANDATLSNGVIQLTKKDKSGNPLKHSVGHSGIIKPIRLYDKSTGEVADFTIEFTFVVNKKGRKDHGDGFAFIFISPSFNFPDSKKSSGGFLGMFTPHTAFNSNQQILLVEFDSFGNEWDPILLSQNAHIGIDVSSIKSVVTVPWFNDFRPDGTVASACISYNSVAKQLSVLVIYPNNDGKVIKADSRLIHEIDLTSVLPEHVQIGFSASTGDLVETHDILSWSFTSKLVRT